MIDRIRKRYRNMDLALKASVWFVFCGVLKDAVDVLVTPIFTRILTTEQYGVFNVYNSWFQIVKILFTLYLFSDVFNVGLVKFSEDRDRFISATLGFITASVGAYFVLYLVFRTRLESIIGLPGFLILLLFAHVLVYVPYYCWIRRERFDYHYKSVVIVSLLYIVLQPFCGIIAILCLDIPLNPGYTRILAAVGIQILIGIVLYAGMMARGKVFYSGKYWRYSLKTGIVLVPYNLSKVVLNQCDRIMINHYSGAGDTGIYSVAHSAAFVLLAVTEALDGAFVPWLYRKLKTRECTGVRRMINLLIVLVAICVLAINLIAPELMKLLARKEYYEGVYCIPALVYSVYLIFVYTIFSNIELFFGKNSYVTAASTVGMIVNIVLNALFIPRYGFVAASYTTMAGFFTICIGHFLLLRKSLAEENMKMSDLIDIRAMLAVSGVMLALSLLCLPLYRWGAIRWSLIALLCMGVFFSRDRWLGLITKLKGEEKEDG